MRPRHPYIVRIALLEYSKIHEKAYKFIVCEFGGFQNVLRDACVRAIPTPTHNVYSDDDYI